MDNKSNYELRYNLASAEEKIKVLEKELTQQHSLCELYKSERDNMERTLEECGERIADLEQGQILEMQEHQEAMKVSDARIKELEKQVFELTAENNLCKYKPAFCELAGRECHYLGKVEELQHQLKVSEKALELACDKLAYKYCFQMGEDAFCGDCKPCLIDYFKDQAKEIMKSE